MKKKGRKEEEGGRGALSYSWGAGAGKILQSIVDKAVGWEGRINGGRYVQSSQ